MNNKRGIKDKYNRNAHKMLSNKSPGEHSMPEFL